MISCFLKSQSTINHSRPSLLESSQNSQNLQVLDWSGPYASISLSLTWFGVMCNLPSIINQATRSPSVPVPIQEPLSTDSPLWDMENLLLSPHNADLTPMHLGVEFASLGNFAANPPLRNSNNLELGPKFFLNSCFTPRDRRYMHQTWEIFLQKLSDFTSPSFGGFKDQVDKSCGY